MCLLPLLLTQLHLILKPSGCFSCCYSGGVVSRSSGLRGANQLGGQYLTTTPLLDKLVNEMFCYWRKSGIKLIISTK